MKLISFALLASTVVFACTADDSIAPTTTGGKSGAAGAGGGGGSGAAGLGGAAGRGNPTTTGVAGTTGAAGAAGTGSGAGGSAGAGGTIDGGAGAVPDASIDGELVDGTADANVDVGFPEASTCAGYAIDLDGFSAYGSVPRMVADDFTLEAWIKEVGPSFTGPNFWQGSPVIYADTAGNNNDFGTTVINNHFSLGIGVPGSAEPTIEGLTDVTTGQWFHVAATRRVSTGELQIFIYGELEASVVTTNHDPLNAQALINIGGNTIDGRYFHGAIDEVRIWNVVRSQTELLTNMHTRLLGNEPGLVGYWRFDQPGVMSALDSSPSGANVTLMGPVNWIASDAPVCAARRDAAAPEPSPDAPPDVAADNVAADTAASDAGGG